MQDIHTMLARIKRPGLLIAAARHGLEEYDRSRHLKKILRTERLPGSAEAALKLIELEAALDEERREKSATYLIGRHVDLLVALMAEARRLTAARLKAVD